MGKDSLIHLFETQPFEKGGLVSQGKNPLDSEGLRFIQARLHEFGSYPFLPILFLDREGSNLCQILPAEVQGADAYDFSILGIDKKIPEMVIELTERSGKNISSCGILFD
jgi:hypothetical protein